MVRATRVAVVTALAALSSAASQCQTWYETTAHGPGFRNVSAYGAKGDGVTDDTAALVAALTAGRPSGYTTADPTVVYLPPGRYRITGTLPIPFYTHVVGNALCRPAIVLADNTWPQGGQRYMLDADASDPGGEHTLDFYRALMHLNIDLGTGNGAAIGVHWALSQATAIRNVTIYANDAAAGIFGENGSGGWVSDLQVYGGQTGIIHGNQQWTWRDVTVANATIGINLLWNWAYVFLGLTIRDCPTAIRFQGGATGSLLLLDSTIANAAVGVQTDFPARVPSLLFERLTTVNVQEITSGLAGDAAGTLYVPAWRQGPRLIAGQIQPGSQSPLPLTRPDVPLPRRARPFFGSADGSSGLYNAYDSGAKGDGVTDDTSALQEALMRAPAVFLPQGTYLVSATLQLQPGQVLVGEALSMIVADNRSLVWADASNPQPLLAAPQSDDPTTGVQLADLLLGANGDVPGCIWLDWGSNSASGLWDVHWRIESTGYAALHVHGPGSGIYFENGWGWVADHDITTGANLTVFNPRGFLFEPQAPSWLYGTAAEHSALYQFNISGASNVTVLMAQTESPYWQDPPTAWAMSIEDRSNVSLYGSGFYNWFFGNQSALFSVTGSQPQLYGVNVYGTDMIETGDESIPAHQADTKNWFCDGFIANTPAA